MKGRPSVMLTACPKPSAGLGERGGREGRVGRQRPRQPESLGTESRENRCQDFKFLPAYMSRFARVRVEPAHADAGSRDAKTGLQ